VPQCVTPAFHVGGKGLAENFPMLRFRSDRGAAPAPRLVPQMRFERTLHRQPSFLQKERRASLKLRAPV